MNCRTLIQLLRDRSQQSPEKTAYTFVDDAGAEANISYGQLDAMARSIGACLEESHDAEPALLVYPPGLEYVKAFWGCLYAGVIPIPIPMPRHDRDIKRFQSVVSDSGAQLVVTTEAAGSNLRGRFASVIPDQVRWVTTDGGFGSAEAWNEPSVETHRVAYLQYTSGSTSSPKGVMVTHENVLHNIEEIDASFGHTEQSISVSWLPHFHDMGLIYSIVMPVHKGFRSVLMSPASFVQGPVRWLKVISKYRATHSGAPNFGYELCLRRVTAGDLPNLRLHTWKVAFNGAELIQKDTLDRFANMFESCGFSANSFYPAYGLAESTLKVSCRSKSDVVTVCNVGQAELDSLRVVDTTADDPAGRSVVGCGTAGPDTRIAIVNPHTRALCAANEVGEIWVSSPSVARGYWRRPGETDLQFKAHVPGTEGPDYLRTGDLGFLRGNQLFVSGRLKDLIVIRGSNHYPEDIEFTVQRANAIFQPNSTAAFSVEVSGEERLVIVQETGRHLEQDPEEIASLIRKAVANAHQVHAYAVLLVRKGTVPKTPSGKIQRALCRARFVDRTIPAIWTSVVDTFVSGPAGPSKGGVFDGSVACGEKTVLESLRNLVAEVLGIRSGVIDSELPLSCVGLDSVMAVQLAMSIDETFGIAIGMTDLVGGMTLSDVHRVLQESASPARTTMPASAAVRYSHPLSFGQERLWFLHQVDPANAASNCVRAFRWPGDVNVQAVCDSLHGIIVRHEPLQMTFGLDDTGTSEQTVSPATAPPLAVIDLSESADDFDDALNTIFRAECRQPFDLARGPLLRATLVRQRHDAHVFIIAIHHIAGDGWSLRVFLQELQALYTSITTGCPTTLSPLKCKYTDWVTHQRKQLEGESLNGLLRYWVQQLDGLPPRLTLPIDRQPPAVRTYSGAQHSLSFAPTLVAQLRELARREGATLFMLMLAAFQTLLYRQTGQTDIPLGVPIAGRDRPETRNLIGLFINTVVIRVAFDGNCGFRSNLARLRRTALEAYAHHDLPFQALVRAMKVQHADPYSPLFQVMFAYDNASTSCVPAQRMELLEIGGEPVTHDLVLDLTDAEILRGLCKYSSELFDSATIDRIIRQFNLVLKEVAADSDRPLRSLPLMTVTETAELLSTLNDTKRAFDQNACLHERIKAQAKATPDAIAVINLDDWISYGCLDERANRLAAYLRSRGIRPEMPVAIYLDRSVEVPVALLGILNAGAAYLPIEYDLPEERLRFMLADSEVEIIVSNGRMASSLPPHRAQTVCLDSSWSNISASRVGNRVEPSISRQLAYVLYTSGSTGKPKRVEIAHVSVVNLLDAMQEELQLKPGDTMVAVTTFSFDIAGLELYLPLLVGARVDIVSKEITRDGFQLAQRMARYDSPVMQATPATWRLLLAAGWQGHGGAKILCGGEALPMDLARELLRRGCALWNLYGPTETTIWSTTSRITQDARVVTIGLPIANTSVYVLDDFLQVLPRGISGELYIGGQGVARGYSRLADLTAAQFLPNPFSDEPGARLYRTGDVVRLHSEGRIEFLDRSDRQVKIRGYRLELGEIEDALREHGGVCEAVVVARDNAGERVLVAFIVPRPGQQTSTSDVRNFLCQKLPSYMIPSYCVLIPELPLTPNGKLNKRVLETMPVAAPTAQADRRLPRTPVETSLASMWSSVLHISDIAVDDNFFELGGHSLLLTVVASKIRRVFHVELPLRTLFDNPTISRLATQILRAQLGQETEEAVLAMIEEVSCLSPADIDSLLTAERDSVPLNIT